MKRLADLDPAVGSEANKRRPILIVSNNANNRASPTVTILPITSNVSRVFPFETSIAPEEKGLDWIETSHQAESLIETQHTKARLFLEALARKESNSGLRRLAAGPRRFAPRRLRASVLLGAVYPGRRDVTGCARTG